MSIISRLGLIKAKDKNSIGLTLDRQYNTNVIEIEFDRTGSLGAHADFPTLNNILTDVAILSYSLSRKTNLAKLQFILSELISIKKTF